jgi:hypothetical protein
MFDRVCVISLDRRQDRLERFYSDVPKDFPFGTIETVQAIDGSLVRHPGWWRQGGGAWGCYRSHVRIIEDALNNNQESVLIFEDDATFVTGFARRALAYLADLPQDWKQAYLGGQHLRRPMAVPGHSLCVAAANINRTHAYAIRGREALTEIYKWLNATDQWVNRNHIDHHYGRLHKRNTRGYYAPMEWLCGQAEGKSNISGKLSTERWWGRTKAPLPAAVAAEERKFVAVLGLHRSGSSATAMMLHKLGVSMGDKLGGYEGKHGGGGEAVGLASICEWASPFPKAEIIRPRRDVSRRLGNWIHKRTKTHRLAGAKYPHLCAMGDELVQACGESLRVIVCDRPIEESIDSLQRRSRKSKGWLAASDEDCEKVQRWLFEEREAFLERVAPSSVLRLSWSETRDDPAATVQKMIEFLGIEPTDEQMAAAVGHIREEAVA